MEPSLLTALFSSPAATTPKAAPSAKRRALGEISANTPRASTPRGGGAKKALLPSSQRVDALRPATPKASSLSFLDESLDLDNLDSPVASSAPVADDGKDCASTPGSAASRASSFPYPEVLATLGIGATPMMSNHDAIAALSSQTLGETAADEPDAVEFEIVAQEPVAAAALTKPKPKPKPAAKGGRIRPARRSRLAVASGGGGGRAARGGVSFRAGRTRGGKQASKKAQAARAKQPLGTIKPRVFSNATPRVGKLPAGWKLGRERVGEDFENSDTPRANLFSNGASPIAEESFCEGDSSMMQHSMLSAVAGGSTLFDSPRGADERSAEEDEGEHAAFDFAGETADERAQEPCAAEGVSMLSAASSASISTSQYRAVRRENAALKKRFEQLGVECETNADFAERAGAYADLWNRLEAKKQILEETEAKMHASAGVLFKLNNAFTVAKAELDHSRGECASLETTHKAQTVALAGAQSALAAQAREVAALKTRVAALEAQLAAAATTHANERAAAEKQHAVEVGAALEKIDAQASAAAEERVEAKREAERALNEERALREGAAEARADTASRDRARVARLETALDEAVIDAKRQQGRARAKCAALKSDAAAAASATAERHAAELAARDAAHNDASRQLEAEQQLWTARRDATAIAENENLRATVKRLRATLATNERVFAEKDLDDQATIRTLTARNAEMNTMLETLEGQSLRKNAAASTATAERDARLARAAAERRDLIRRFDAERARELTSSAQLQHERAAHTAQSNTMRKQLAALQRTVAEQQAASSESQTSGRARESVLNELYAKLESDRVLHMRRERQWKSVSRRISRAPCLSLFFSHATLRCSDPPPPRDNPRCPQTESELRHALQTRDQHLLARCAAGTPPAASRAVARGTPPLPATQRIAAAPMRPRVPGGILKLVTAGSAFDLGCEISPERFAVVAPAPPVHQNAAQRLGASTRRPAPVASTSTSGAKPARYGNVKTGRTPHWTGRSRSHRFL